MPGASIMAAFWISGCSSHRSCMVGFASTLPCPVCWSVSLDGFIASSIIATLRHPQNVGRDNRDERGIVYACDLLQACAHRQRVFFADGEALLDLPHRHETHSRRQRHIQNSEFEVAQIGAKGGAGCGSLVMAHCAASFSGIVSFPACSNACAKALVASCSPTSVFNFSWYRPMFSTLALINSCLAAPAAN